MRFERHKEAIKSLNIGMDAVSKEIDGIRTKLFLNPFEPPLWQPIPEDSIPEFLENIEAGKEILNDIELQFPLSIKDKNGNPCHAWKIASECIIKILKYKGKYYTIPSI